MLPSSRHSGPAAGVEVLRTRERKPALVRVASDPADWGGYTSVCEVAWVCKVHIRQPSLGRKLCGRPAVHDETLAGDKPRSRRIEQKRYGFRDVIGVTNSA